MIVQSNFVTLHAHEQVRQPKKMITLFKTALPCSFFLCAGCATIFTGTTQTITVQSDPQGAWVLVNGEERGLTPLEVTLNKSKNGDSINLALIGYDTLGFRPETKFSPVCILNLYNPVAWVIDGFSGAMWHYKPDTYILELVNDNIANVIPVSDTLSIPVPEEYFESEDSPIVDYDSVITVSNTLKKSGFSVGYITGLGFSQYNPQSSDFGKPDILGEWGFGWGWGALVPCIDVGATITYSINSRLAFSSGLLFSQNGGSFYNNKVSVYNPSASGGLTYVDAIDSAFAYSNAFYNITKRTYDSKYVTVPLTCLIRLTSEGNRVSTSLAVGTRQAFLLHAKASSGVNMLSFDDSLYGEYQTEELTLTDDMQKFLFAVTLGMETEWAIRGNFSMSWGLETIRSLKNPLQNDSKFFLDKERSEESFSAGGPAIPLHQEFLLSATSLRFGLKYHF